MILEIREQAYDALRNCCCRERQSMALSDGLLRQAVQSECDALDGSFPNQSCEHLAMDDSICEFARGYTSRAAGEFEGASSIGRSGHVANTMQLCINGKVWPQWVIAQLVAKVCAVAVRTAVRKPIRVPCAERMCD